MLGNKSRCYTPIITREKMTNLTLFFTTGMSLRAWEENGSFDREMALYHLLAQELSVDMVTYGGSYDGQLHEKIKPVTPLPLHWYWRWQDARFALPELIFKYHSRLTKTVILKTNQIKGSELALIAKKIYKKKLYLRSGYLLSEFTEKQTDDKKIITKARRLEREAFLDCDIASVTTQRQKDFVLDRYPIKAEKINVVPNYVLTDVFCPKPGALKKFDLIFVGRNSGQKNIDGLLTALKYLREQGVKVRTALVGVGKSMELKKKAEEMGLAISTFERVPMRELSTLMQESRIYILPSLYEGHPKTLLEAMSSGLPCIGTQVTGIKEEISHEKTGWLTDSDPKAIAAAIMKVLESQELQKKLGENARKDVVKKYALKVVAEKELAIIEQLSGKIH